MPRPDTSLQDRNLGGWIAAIFVGGLLVLGGIAWLVTTEEGLPHHAWERPEHGKARIACRDYIEERLHDPSSVEWGDLIEWTASEMHMGEITVWPRFRARNTYGALVLERRTCLVDARPSLRRARVISLRDFP